MTLKGFAIGLAFAIFALSLSATLRELDKGTKDQIAAQRNCINSDIIYVETWSGRLKSTYFCPYGLHLEYAEEVELEEDYIG